jgi:purine nucleosidase
MVPLDVTYQCIFTTDHLAQISSKNPKVKGFIADSTRFYMEFHEEYQSINGCAINDPLAAAILIKPELCNYQDFYLEVELKESASRGQTLIDYFNISQKPSNVKLALSVNVPAFMDFFISRINQL